MPEYLIHVQPKDLSETSQEIDLDDIYDKEDLFECIDDLFHSLSQHTPNCSKCGGITKWQQSSPKGWWCIDDSCDSVAWSDETEREVIYSILDSKYYNELLKTYGYVTPEKIHSGFRDFIDTFDKVDNTPKENAFIAYLDNMMFNATKHDISRTYSDFEDNYIGYSGSSDNERTQEWYGHYLVENDIVSVPEDLENCIDYSSLANDDFVGGSVWSSDGYVFHSR